MKKSPAVKEKDHLVSNLRIICIILVVFGHSIIIYKNGWNLYGTDIESPFLDYLCRFIYLFHMPLFFSISGFLAKYSYSKKPNAYPFIKKKIIRLLLPFLIIGTLYMLPIRLLAHYPGYINNSIQYNLFLNIILGKDCGHLWFLPSLFLIFVIHYTMNRLFGFKIAPSIIYTFFLAIVLYIASDYLPSFIGKASENLLWFHFGFTINYVLEYVRKRITSYISSVFFLISTFVALYAPKEMTAAILTPIIAALAIIMFFSVMPKKEPSKIFRYIEANSFGIYLFHSPLIYIMFYYIPNINPLLMVFVNFLILGGISSLMSAIVRRTKFKFIVGE